MTGRLTRRGLVGLGAAALVGAACRVPASPTPPLAQESSKQDGWTPILPSSDLAVGPNRFLYAVLDERNRPIRDAKVHLRFFDLSAGEAAPVAESDAPFRGQGLGDKGVYVARVSLPRAGAWGVEAQIERPDGTKKALRTRFEVAAQSKTPAIGAAAPPSRQPLLKDVADPKIVCTAPTPCAFHDITVADALGLRKPALLLFATPAFCSSATCGPDLETVQGIEPSFRERVTFMHLEIYADPPTLEKTHRHVEEWRLPSEPWVFVLEREGKVADKLEGGITGDELREVLTRVV
jgi:hypothetical protein